MAPIADAKPQGQTGRSGSFLILMGLFLSRRLSPHDQARKLWAAFLRNHRDVTVAMDFFTLPTLTFRVLVCFFVIEHGRRKIVHFNVTEHPTGPWIEQQLREAFPGSCPYRYAILDRDGKFGGEVRLESGSDWVLSTDRYMVEIVERASNINGFPSNWGSWVRQHCSPSELFRKFCIIYVRK